MKIYKFIRTKAAITLYLLSFLIAFILFSNHPLTLASRLIIRYFSNYNIHVTNPKGNLLNFHIDELSFNAKNKHFKLNNINVEHNFKDLMLLRPSKIIANIKLANQTNVTIHHVNNLTLIDIKQNQFNITLSGKNYHIYRAIKLSSKKFKYHNNNYKIFVKASSTYSSDIKLNVNFNLNNLKDILNLDKSINVEKANGDLNLFHNIKNGETYANGHIDKISINNNKYGDIVLEDSKLEIKPVKNKIDIKLSAKANSEKYNIKVNGNINPNEDFKITTFTRISDLHLNSEANDIKLGATIKSRYFPLSRRLFINAKAPVSYGKIIIPLQNKKSIDLSPDVVIKQEKDKKEKSLNIDAGIKLITMQPVDIRAGKAQAKINSNIYIKYETNEDIKIKGDFISKEGSINLLGKYLDIEHANIYYPKLSRPNAFNIDMKLIKKLGDLKYGLIIQGSLLQPLITPFSNKNLTEEEIYSKLGLNVTKLYQLATLSLKAMNYGDYSTKDKIQKKLSVDVEMDKNSPTSSEGVMANTKLVFSKQLSDKLFIQYIHKLLSSDNSIKIYYEVNDKWDFGIANNNKSPSFNVNFKLAKD